eukprot:727069-Pleurochrysis_carterae.AAC.4
MGLVRARLRRVFAKSSMASAQGYRAGGKTCMVGQREKGNVAFESKSTFREAEVISRQRYSVTADLLFRTPLPPHPRPQLKGEGVRLRVRVPATSCGPSRGRACRSRRWPCRAASAGGCCWPSSTGEAPEVRATERRARERGEGKGTSSQG